MKNQYFGDFGDYQKISLLNLLKKKFSTTVHWMKTEDDGSSDGRHITYLSKPSTWREFEPGIFDFLEDKIRKDIRHLSHIEKSIWGKGIHFMNGCIEDAVYRAQSVQDILNSAADIVLFDPDNGIEVASSNDRNKHKYVSWSEIQTVFDSGKSVIVYQHFPRVNREAYIEKLLKTISEKIDTIPFALKVKHSVYLFIPQECHRGSLNDIAVNFTNAWGEYAHIFDK